MKVRRIVSVITLVMVFAMMMVPLEDVSAATKRPYKDITVKKVGKIGYESIKVTKKYGVWKGIVKTKGKKKNKFEKKKAMKVKDCFKAWKNDKRIPKKYIHVAKADKKIWNKTATCGWVYAKYSAMAKEMYQVGKYGLLWDTTYKGTTKVNRLRFAVISAAVKDPYVDVTKKTVTKSQWLAIMWCKDHGVYKNVVSGKYLGPQNIPPRGSIVKMLLNSHNKVPVEACAEISSTEPVTFGWLYYVTEDVYKLQTNNSFVWQNREKWDKKANMAQVSSILWELSSKDKKLMPKQ